MTILPPRHPLAKSADDLPIAALHGERVMTNGPLYLSSLQFMTACTLEGIETDVVFESPIGQVLSAYVDAGMAIAVCGDRTDVRGFDLPRRRLVDASGSPLAFDLSICWTEQAGTSEPMLAFAHALAAFRPSFPALSAVA